jgi:hypothetical protein
MTQIPMVSESSITNSGAKVFKFGAKMIQAVVTLVSEVQKHYIIF